MSKKVFVIMPSEDFYQSKEKREIIQSSALEHGWTAQLPEYDRNKPSFDLIATMTALGKSDLVLVDLSNERPSCYFELGLAETLGLNIAAFAVKGTPIHQTSLRADVRFFVNLSEYGQKIDQSLNGQGSIAKT